MVYLSEWRKRVRFVDSYGSVNSDDFSRLPAVSGIIRPFDIRVLEVGMFFFFNYQIKCLTGFKDYLYIYIYTLLMD